MCDLKLQSFEYLMLSACPDVRHKGEEGEMKPKSCQQSNSKNMKPESIKEGKLGNFEWP